MEGLLIIGFGNDAMSCKIKASKNNTLERTEFILIVGLRREVKNGEQLGGKEQLRFERWANFGSDAGGVCFDFNHVPANTKLGDMVKIRNSSGIAKLGQKCTVGEYRGHELDLQIRKPNPVDPPDEKPLSFRVLVPKDK